MKTIEELVGNHPLGAIAILAVAQGAYEAGRAYMLACTPTEPAALIEWKKCSEQALRAALIRVRAVMAAGNSKVVYESMPLMGISWDRLDDVSKGYIDIFVATAKAMLTALEVDQCDEGWTSPFVVRDS